MICLMHYCSPGFSLAHSFLHVASFCASVSVLISH
jgi:hypothetical protein